MTSALHPPLLVLGHRGAISDHFGFQQNSLKAFEEAVTGGDGFETDACADKDGEVFLIHETRDIGYGATFKGVAYAAAEHLDVASAQFMNGRRIDQMTTADMRRLRLKDGSPIPTLKEALALVGSHAGKLLNIELKGQDVVLHVLRIVRQAMQDGIIKPENLLISSFNYPALEIVRKDAPELRVGAIFLYPDAPSQPLFPWMPGGGAGFYMPLTVATLEQDVLKRVQPDIFIMPEELLTESNIAMIAARYTDARCAAWLYTEKGHFDMAGLLRRLEVLQSTGRVAAVMVDNPREFVRAMRG